MTVTPQTNTDLNAIARVLDGYASFAICGHVSPDGDCLGSQLALAHRLKSLGKQVTCLLVKDEPIEDDLAFLPGARDMVPASRFAGEPDVFIAVDVPSEERLGDAAAVKARCAVTVTIDHHAAPLAMSRYSYTDPDSPSTTMLVWKLLAYMPGSYSKEEAVCCYTGLVTDTGRFQFQNTDAEAFELAASMVEAGAEPDVVSREVFQNRRMQSLLLEARAIEHMSLECDGQVVISWLSQSDFEQCDAVKSDSEPLINTLRSIKGVRVACMLRDQGTEIRGSFRAKDDTDVAVLAERLGGGGHKAAAGFTLHCTIETALEDIRTMLCETIGR